MNYKDILIGLFLLMLAFFEFRTRTQLRETNFSFQNQLDQKTQEVGLKTLGADASGGVSLEKTCTSLRGEWIVTSLQCKVNGTELREMTNQIERLSNDIAMMKSQLGSTVPQINKAAKEPAESMNPKYKGYIGHGKEVKGNKSDECSDVTGDAYCSGDKLNQQVLCRTGKKVEIKRVKSARGHDKISYGCIANK